MKTLVSFCTLSLFAASAFADIQDPPGNDQGPTRKLGRGLANVMFCPNELIHVMCQINDREGNEAAASYGIVRGLGRVFARAGYGVYEVATFPIPTFWSSYRPPYKSDPPWIHGGFSEFPPELGWQTRYNYCRPFTGY